jgi:hypothetical protein
MGLNLDFGVLTMFTPHSPSPLPERKRFGPFVHVDSPHSNVKDESSNLNNLTTTLSSIVMCAPLQLEQPFASFCFGDAMGKTCQYATNDKKNNVGLEVSLKNA